MSEKPTDDFPSSARGGDRGVGWKQDSDALLTRWERWTRGPNRSTYLLTRFAILRLLGLVYAVAFLTVIDQGPGLLGDNGLLPISTYMGSWGSAWSGFVAKPSLLWLGGGDTAMMVYAWLGLLLALAVLAGAENALVMLGLWVLHTSIANLGQLWYAFGWEFQLLETGFLAVFLCPLTRIRPLSERGPPRVVIVLFRWLCFRIMLGAGLIKMRGDACWDFSELTCLVYHYETQPVPNPVSPVLHAMPIWFHQLGVLYNHLCELILPFFVFGPRRARHIAGVLLVTFQVILIISGNLSFLNRLTIVPMLACFDDSLYRRLVPGRFRPKLDEKRMSAEPQPSARWTAGALAVIVAVLSLGPVSNLLSSRQAMNRSFDRLHLVNTYGAFGSVGKTRYEIVFEGSYAEERPEESEWFEIEFRCKPGDPNRRPCLISPYHLRLDWLIWFAAMAPAERSPWVYHLAYKILIGEPDVLDLLDDGPVQKRKPRWLRASLYRYEFAPLGDDAVWKRERVAGYIPPITAHTPELLELLRGYGWLSSPPNSDRSDH